MEHSMSDDMKLGIKLQADGKNLETNIKKAKVTIDSLGKSGAETGNKIAAGMGKAETASKNASIAFSKTRQGITSISHQLANLQRFAAGAFVFTGIEASYQSLTSLSDSYTTVMARLHLATKSQQKYNTAFLELTKITRNSLGDFGATVDLYSSMARATQDLHLQQSTLLTVTDAVNKAIVVSGASSQSAEAALIQLGQGLASGTLRGEELNSVLEQTPRIARMIADGAGIAFGDLRKVAMQGGLTSEVVIKALHKEAATVNAEFHSIPPTIAGASRQVHNSMMQIWGDFTTTSGAANGLASSILFVADNLKAILVGAFVAAKLATVAFTARLVVSSIAANTATLSLAGLRTASLGLFMLYKSGGIKTLLKAPFISMATATKTALAGVSKLTLAGSVLFAAYAGWEIGTYLSDQFAIVRKSGIAMAGGLSNLAINTTYAFKAMSASIGAAFSGSFDIIKKAFAGLVGSVAKGLDFLKLGSHESNQNMIDFAAALDASANSAGILKQHLKTLNAERKAALKNNDVSYVAAFAAADQKPTSPSQQQTPSSSSSGSASPVQPNAKTAAALKDAVSLTQKLSTAYDDSFTKISDQYVATWQKLVATQGEGSAKVKALETAYQTWSAQTMDKQGKAEAAKALAASRAVIDIHSAKFARMDAMGAVASGSERDKLQASLTVKLDALTREQQQVEEATLAQGGNIGNIRAYYDEQRISTAKAVADKLKIIDEQGMTDRLALLEAGEQAALNLKGQFQQLATANQQVNLNTMATNLANYASASVKWDKFTGQQKLQFASASLGALAGLMKSHNRKAFEIGKAAAQGENAINTYLGATKAYQAMVGIPIIGPVLGIAAAAAVVTAGVANAQKISSAKMGGATGGVSIPTISAGGGGSAPQTAMNPNTGLPQQTPTTQKQPNVVHIKLDVNGLNGTLSSQDAQMLSDILTPSIADNLARKGQQVVLMQ